ncbi:hypothetical protein AVEN_77196-1, partial [Araneus ventricosus]
MTSCSQVGGTDFYDDLGMPPMWLHRLLRRLGNATTVAPSTS